MKTFFWGTLSLCVSLVAIALRFELSNDQLYLCSLLSIVFSVCTIITEAWSPAYVIRYFLLAAPGCWTAYLLMNEALGTHVMNYALTIQSRELAVWVSLLTSLALSGHALGWRLGSTAASKFPQSLFPSEDLMSEKQFKSYFYFFTSVAVISGFLFSRALKAFVWEAAYSLQRQEPLFGVGAYNFLIVCSLIAILSLLLQTRHARFKDWLLFGVTAIYSLMFCMLFRGMRAEFVGFFFGSVILLSVHYKIRWKGYQVLSALSIGYLFVLCWGIYRATAPTGFGLMDSLEYLKQNSNMIDKDGNFFIQTSTFGDIAATLYDSIALVQSKAVTLMNGQTYLDYIPRTLPAFISPERPRDLSLIFYDFLIPQGGGIFELTEAYFNFGDWGCLLIPLLISFIIGFFIESGKRSASLPIYVLIGCLSAAIFRGTLYQTFVFYRILTIIVTLLIVAKTITWFLIPKRKAEISV